MFTKKFTLFERWLNAVSVTVVAVLMLLVTANVIGRYVLNMPIEATLEFTEFFMVAVVYLALAHTQAAKANINIDLVTSRLHLKNRAACDLISHIVSLCLFALIVWHGSRMFMESWEMREISMGRIELPVYPSKLLVPFGSLIVCIRFLIDIVEDVRTLKGREK